MKKTILNTLLWVIVIVLFICLLFLLSLWVPAKVKTLKLIRAVESNDIILAQSLLESGVDPNRTDIKPSKFWMILESTPRRPLTIACRKGNLQMVKLLIDYGATAEYIEGADWSPLRATLFYYQPDDSQIIDLLLENGADPNAVDDMLPVFAAAEMIPKVYDAQKTNGTVFCTGYDEETAVGISKIVTVLLGENSVNIRNDSGKTLLMLAVLQENVYLTEYLLQLGCDSSIEDIKGNTALDYARQTNNSAIINLLERQGTVLCLDVAQGTAHPSPHLKHPS